MRILQVNHSHYIRGGADVVYFNTANLLKEKGHEVSFFSKLHQKNGTEKKNEYFVRYIDFHNSSFFRKLISVPKYLYNREAYRNIMLLIKEFKPDIAHVHLFYGSLTISILRAMKKMNVPIVHTVHDYRLLCPVYSFLDSDNKICESCKNHQFISCLKKRCSDGSVFQSAVVTAEAYFWHYGYSPLNLIDHFIFVSRFIQEKHIEYNPLYADKSSQLYNFQNFENGIPGQGAVKGKYMLYFGRLSREKGIETLLKTFSEDNIKIIIAGRGPMTEIVENYSRKFRNIQYVGFQHENSLKELIQKSSFVVVPSEWYENNPMTIIESLSLGKPVIGSKIGGIPELIEDQVNGFLFTPGQTESLRAAIQKANSLKKEEYINMSKNARIFAEHNFSRENHYQSLLTIYEKTIKNQQSNIPDLDKIKNYA